MSQKVISMTSFIPSVTEHFLYRSVYVSTARTVFSNQTHYGTPMFNQFENIQLTSVHTLHSSVHCTCFALVNHNFYYSNIFKEIKLTLIFSYFEYSQDIYFCKIGIITISNKFKTTLSLHS